LWSALPPTPMYVLVVPRGAAEGGLAARLPAAAVAASRPGECQVGAAAPCFGAANLCGNGPGGWYSAILLQAMAVLPQCRYNVSMAVCLPYGPFSSGLRRHTDARGVSGKLAAASSES
jgi:hypothetical protein